MSQAMFRETHSRSIAKALSWRILGSVATTVLVFVFTRRVVVSLAVGAVEFLAKIGLFWVHERAWDRLRFGRREVEPAVIWFTGLSGSGKSTIAHGVVTALRARGLRVEHLDGDTVRGVFPNTGFSREERDAHIRRVGFLASTLERQGVFVVASFVSPFEDSRQFVRGLCKHFLEIHVSTPLDVCESRDVKGLYARARRGDIQDFTGIDSPYEVPVAAALTIDTSTVDQPTAVRAVLDLLEQAGLET